MWDLLVITAGEERQADIFRRQLQDLDLSLYTRDVLVFPDPPDGGRIGAGGSMIYLAHELKQRYPKVDKMKVLLIHSGGYAQRMPYQSIYGKVFSHIGAGTVLEMKLDTYQYISKILPNGLLVAASDVVEDTRGAEAVDFKQDVEMILFATECDLETAIGHGVFVGPPGSLACVLQKPSVREMEECRAISAKGTVLTDCFYWMSWGLLENLGKLKGARPIEQELCCYGDFMRPLGTRPNLSYLTQGPLNLQQWRADLNEVFKGATNQLVNLGPDAFFHLGTHSELLQHLAPGSRFHSNFLKSKGSSTIYSRINQTFSTGIPELGPLVEFSDAPNTTVGCGSIVSCLETEKAVEIPENIMVFTVALKGGSFASCAVHKDDNVKEKRERLRWMDMDCGKNVSLWTAPIYPVRRTREESLDALLTMLEGKRLDADGESISLERIVFHEADLEENLLYRQKLRRLFREE